MTERCDCTTCPLADLVTFWERLAEGLLPDTRTLEGELRWAHRDLADLPTERLAREAAQIAQVLPWLRPRHPSAPWLAERLHMLQGELARRESDGR